MHILWVSPYVNYLNEEGGRLLREYLVHAGVNTRRRAGISQAIVQKRKTKLTFRYLRNNTNTRNE